MLEQHKRSGQYRPYIVWIALSQERYPQKALVLEIMTADCAKEKIDDGELQQERQTCTERIVVMLPVELHHLFLHLFRLLLVSFSWIFCNSGA